MKIAIIAHDAKKELMVQFCSAYCGILSKHTGKPLETIAKDTERDNFMSAEEAVEYHLIDKIISKDSRG